MAVPPQKKKQFDPSSFTPQSKKASAAEDKAVPGKHNPYSKAEAQKEAMWRYITKHRKAHGTK